MVYHIEPFCRDERVKGINFYTKEGSVAQTQVDYEHSLVKFNKLFWTFTSLTKAEEN